VRNDLLLAAGGRESSDVAVDAARTFDWDYLVRAADRQGVAPLLHEWLRAQGNIAVPSAVASRLHDLYWIQHFRSRIMLGELERIFESARDAGIELLPMKGAVLSVEYYTTPALRPMSDLDLLVRLADLDRLDDMLSRLEYTPLESTPSYAGDAWLDRASLEHIWATTRDGVHVIVEYRAAALQTTTGRVGDLDRTLVNALREYTDATWQRAVRSRGNPSGRAQPSREDLLLHVAGHLAAQHSDFRLIWLHDLRSIVTQADGALDWAYVRERAAALRIAAATWAALQAAAEWVGAPIPASVLDDLRDATEPGSSTLFQRWERRRLGEHLAAIGDADLSAGGFAIWPVPAALSRMRGWMPRVKMLLWAAFPSREYLRHRGARPGLLGYLTMWMRRWLSVFTRSSTDRHT